MPDRPWKAEERGAAALFGGRRFPANSGGEVDFETTAYIGQVKHVRRLALAQLEGLAQRVERIGSERTPPKAGVVVVKRRAGRGQPTPRLVIFTERAWRARAPALARDPSQPPGSKPPAEVSGVGKALAPDKRSGIR